MAGEAPPDIYLRFTDDGDNLIGKLQGESMDAQNPGWWDSDNDDKGWFTVTSFQFSIAGDKDGGGGGGGVAPAPAKGGTSGGSSGASGSASSSDVFKGITITMPLQLGCILLMYRCVQFAQKHQEPQRFKKIPKAEIRVRRAGLSNTATAGSGQDYFIAIFLTKVTVENYSMNSSCIQESFTLNYETMMIEYFATDPETRQLDETKGDGYSYAKWSINADDDSADAG